MAANDDQRQVFWEICQGFDGQKNVLPSFDGADIEDEPLWETVVEADLLLFPFRAGFEARGTTLIDDGDMVVANMSEFHDVALRALADGDDMVGLANGLTELPGIDLRVYPVIKLRMTQEDEVVDGDDATDATLADAPWEFA